MSLFADPTAHFDNPPHTWQVVKVADRCWHLDVEGFGTLHYGKTKKECEALKLSGFYVNLYEKESRWYRGEPVQGWKPYAGEVVGMREPLTSAPQ